MSNLHTPGPWRTESRDGYWDVLANDPMDPCSPWEIAHIVSGASDDLPEEVVDQANACLCAAAPAYQLAWSLVPQEIKDRIFDILHKPDSEWVETAIARAEGGQP